MRKIVLFAGYVSCVVAVVGCSFLKKKEEADAAADAAVVASDAATAAADASGAAPIDAKNAAEVARFAAETPVSDDDVKLVLTAAVRTVPKAGAVVATLKPGTDVIKHAEYQNCVLVTFADPKDASAKLMGWIGKEAFSAAVVTSHDAGVTDAGHTDAGAKPVTDAGAPKLTCAAGSIAVILTKDPVCRKKCAKDAECKGGVAGSCANATTVTGTVARVCASE
jgi:hypothetical protein